VAEVTEVRGLVHARGETIERDEQVCGELSHTVATTIPITLFEAWLGISDPFQSAVSVEAPQIAARLEPEKDMTRERVGPRLEGVRTPPARMGQTRLLRSSGRRPPRHTIRQDVG
jgi:hypothetical protein